MNKELEDTPNKTNCLIHYVKMKLNYSQASEIGFLFETKKFYLHYLGKKKNCLPIFNGISTRS